MKKGRKMERRGVGVEMGTDVGGVYQGLVG